MSPRDPPTCTNTTTLALTAPSTGTTTSDDNAEATTTTVPVLQATASMCHHCFDVLLHQLKRDQQQQKSKTSANNNSTSSKWRLGGGTNLTRSPTASASASAIASSSLSTAQTPAAIFVEDLPHENVECPLFVTWERKRPVSRFHHISTASSSSASKSNSSISNNDQHQQQHQQPYTFELRGCIGTLAPRPLATSIGEYALISAFKDKRFDPVKWTEVPQLRVAVSLLVQYEECRDCHDWHVGVHGIVIRWRSCEGGHGDTTAGGFACDDNNNASSSNTRSSLRFQRAGTRAAAASSDSATGRDYSATYLPEVAADQGWDQQTAVSSLIRKAGFHGPISPDLLARVQCTRYQSSKHRVTFEEYIQQQQQQSSSLSSSQAAAAGQQSQQQEGHDEQTSSPTISTTPLSNDQLVAEAIRELGHLPKLQQGGGASLSSLSSPPPPPRGGRDASPPTCRVL